MNGSVPAGEFEQYRAKAHQSNIRKDPPLVSKTLAKEDARDFALVFSDKLASFIPHIGCIPIGIVDPPHKKARMYRHATLRLNEHSQPINRFVSNELSETPIRYAGTHIEHLTDVWRLRDSFPGKTIFQR